MPLFKFAGLSQIQVVALPLSTSAGLVEACSPMWPLEKQGRLGPCSSQRQRKDHRSKYMKNLKTID